MTEQLDPQPTDKVLEIGTGSGYQAAVLSPLVKEVYSIEIVERSASTPADAQAAEIYQRARPRSATAIKAGPSMPRSTRSSSPARRRKCRKPLVEQLKEGGRMIMPPSASATSRCSICFKKEDGKLVSEALRPTLFVPMTGKAEEQAQGQARPAASHAHQRQLRRNEQGRGCARGVALLAAWPIDGGCTEGKRALTFTNDVPGRGCQAVQAFPVDGRKVDQLDISAWVKVKDAQPGQTPEQLPMMAITFYDTKRVMVGQADSVRRVARPTGNTRKAHTRAC